LQLSNKQHPVQFPELRVTGKHARGKADLSTINFSAFSQRHADIQNSALDL